MPRHVFVAGWTGYLGRAVIPVLAARGHWVRALVRAGAAVDAPMPSGTQPIEQAARRILPLTVAAMVELGADPGRGLDALLSWWSVGVRSAGYRADDVADVIDILRTGGADVTERHRELAASAGASQVEAALHR